MAEYSASDCSPVHAGTKVEVQRREGAMMMVVGAGVRPSNRLRNKGSQDNNGKHRRIVCLVLTVLTHLHCTIPLSACARITHGEFSMSCLPARGHHWQLAPT